MAQVAPPLTYLYHIPSVHESNGGVLETLDLNRSALAGALIDPQNLSHAKTVAKALKTIHDLSIDDRVTGAVVESAELRVAAVEAAHVAATYMPVDAQALQNINNRLNQMDHQIAEALAISRNTQVLAHNRLHGVPCDYRPLYKTIQGNGLDLANHIYGHIAGLQDILIVPTQKPAVGTVPPNFSTNFTAYTRADFVRLIIFYNEDFGIVVSDTIQTSIDKLWGFMKTY